MFSYNGTLCYIEELNSNNEFILFTFLKENEDEYRRLIYDDNIPETREAFSVLLNKYFSNGRLYQFLIFDNKTEKIIGTFFFYGYTEAPISIKISCFFEKNVRGKFIVCEALVAAMMFCLFNINIEKIYFSIYNYNVYMLKISKKLKAIEIKETEHNNVIKLKKSFYVTKNQIKKLIKYKYELL